MNTFRLLRSAVSNVGAMHTVTGRIGAGYGHRLGAGGLGGAGGAAAAARRLFQFQTLSHSSVGGAKTTAFAGVGQRWALGSTAIQQLRQAVTRRMCSGGKAAKPAPKSKPKADAKAAEVPAGEGTFMEMAQIDSGFYQGGAVLIGATLASMIATQEQKGTALAAVVSMMRTVMGISYENISDKDLLYDHIMVNIEVKIVVFQKHIKFCNLSQLLSSSSTSIQRGFSLLCCSFRASGFRRLRMYEVGESRYCLERTRLNRRAMD